MPAIKSRLAWLNCASWREMRAASSPMRSETARTLSIPRVEATIHSSVVSG